MPHMTSKFSGIQNILEMMRFVWDFIPVTSFIHISIFKLCVR